MCQAVTCQQCGKTTWAGCGQHVDQVLRGVPSAERCRGHERAPKAEVPARSGIFSRLFEGR